MKLYGTPPSHFTRKVRVILQELGIPYQFIVVENLLETGEQHFAQNPLHQIPVLEDGDHRLFESDLIAEYLLERYGTGNPALSLFPSGDLTQHKQRLAVMNGGMAAGVKLIRAKRSGISWDYPFFRQEEAALRAALGWLERDLGTRNYYGGEERLSLLEIALVCFVDWAVFREMIDGLEPYPQLTRFVGFHGYRMSFASTHPAVKS